MSTPDDAETQDSHVGEPEAKEMVKVQIKCPCGSKSVEVIAESYEMAMAIANQRLGLDCESW